jgi:hypothetical protein
MIGRHQFLAVGLVETAQQQCDNRLVVNGANGTAALRAESPAGKIRGAIGGWLAAGAGPIYGVSRKLNPRSRKRSRVPLAHLARAVWGFSAGPVASNRIQPHRQPPAWTALLIAHISIKGSLLQILAWGSKVGQARRAGDAPE